MIKTILIISFLTCGAYKSFAQQDTSAYQAQRVKINMLLAERSKNFGQYDESLTQRSGIFGLQTKKDLRNSNEILRSIVLKDNTIFKEIKALMEYKDLKNQQKLAEVGDYTERISGYMHTIKKLQDEQIALKKLLSTKKQASSPIIWGFLGICFGVSLTLLVLVVKNRKASN